MVNIVIIIKDILKVVVIGVGYVIGIVGIVGGMFLGVIFVLRK